MGRKTSGREKFVATYLVLALVFGILGLVDGVVNLVGVEVAIYSIVIGILSGLFFFFNLFAWVHLKHEKAEGITLVLPIYHVISYLLFFGLGIALGLMGLFFAGVFTFFVIVGVITSVFELGFSFYLLRRFEFI